MAGKIPDETLDAIRDRLSLVEVVSGHVSLKKAGRNFLGLCPFHSEKTPSFTVSDERGLFHCFGCGAGGSVFTFVMRIEHCTFPEAVESLARRAGVTLPERAGQSEAQDYRQNLFRLNELAHKHFTRSLQAESGHAARKYIEGRGLQAETIERYGLGFCPPGSSGLVQAIEPKPRAVEAAVHLGLLGKRRDGSCYERFWNRVIFPIRDGSGRILGFGGRTLGEDPPKYLNSPESTLFHKGRVLYGLFEARAAIREAERVVIVEGYMDALALVEAGIAPVVASLGTALTVDQLRLARRFAPEIVAFFDGDRAGQQAAERAFEVCLDAGVWGLGAFLAEGVDPDTFVRTQGLEATRQLLSKAIPLADFFLERLAPGPDATIPERVRAAEKLSRTIARVDDPVTFSLLARQAAQRLGVDEAIFRGARNRPAASARAPERRAAEEEADTDTDVETCRPEEITLIEVMAVDRAAAEIVVAAGILEKLESRSLATAGTLIVEAWASEGKCDAVLDQLARPLAERVAASLLGNGASARGDHGQIARDCIRRIELRAHRVAARSTVARLRELEAGGDERELRKELERSIVLLRQREVPRE